jgi:hypothetical protein
MKAKRCIALIAALTFALGCEAEQPPKAEPASAPPPGPSPAANAPPRPAEPTIEELNAFKPATAKGKVFFKDLKDRAKISGKAFMGAVAVKLQLAAEGVKVEPAGAVRENSGHFAVGIDAQPLPPGIAIKKGSGYQVYEKGETEVQVGVRPGTHKLTLQLVDARSRSYGPEWAQTIEVKVSEK